jgi:hypothetical protein
MYYYLVNKCTYGSIFDVVLGCYKQFNVRVKLTKNQEGINMKNWLQLLAFLTLPVIALVGCASTDEDEPQNHYWQEEDEGEEREERMEREVYRDK